MRKISIVVILIVLMLFPKISASNQIEDTKIKFELKTKNNIVYFQNIPVGYTSPKEEVSEKDQIILKRWREKQLSKWANLSTEQFAINASAYTAAADECGWNTGITASGVKVEENRTLACPPQYPFGTKVKIEGYGTYTCEDRGGAIKGNKFDIYMETKSEAFAFGRRNLTAEVVI
jgi:3D (Asp-Asp-Asp) domain-containing protein